MLRQVNHGLSLTAGMAMAAGACWAGASADAPVYTGSHVLSGGGIVAELMDPNSPDRYNTGVRFTPVAAVIRASVDGREFLMHKKDHKPLNDVAGLFYEFDLVTPPPGFEEASIGEPFVKIGVGALIKDKSNYGFFNQYKVFKLADTKVEWAKDSAVFTQTLAPISGYGYELKAKVSVKDNSLSVDWSLKNTGSKPFTTHHYCHNSFSFDNAGVKPGSIVSFPFDYQARRLDSAQNQKQVGREIVFQDAPSKPANIEVDYPADYKGANSLSFVDKTSGLRIDCETSAPGSRVALHAAPVYVCPEQFVTTAVKPGETMSWMRSYAVKAAK